MQLFMLIVSCRVTVFLLTHSCYSLKLIHYAFLTFNIKLTELIFNMIEDFYDAEFGNNIFRHFEIVFMFVGKCFVFVFL